MSWLGLMSKFGVKTLNMFRKMVKISLCVCVCVCVEIVDTQVLST